VEHSAAIFHEQIAVAIRLGRFVHEANFLAHDRCGSIRVARMRHRASRHVRFSNRPIGVKRFQTTHHCSVDVARGLVLLFSNRPIGVKRFQTTHHCSVDVARGLVLLFGIGTKALPSWDSRTRWNNL